MGGDVTVTVRIEKKDGASYQAVNGHVDGNIRDIEKLIETAKRSAIGMCLEKWLKTQ